MGNRRTKLTIEELDKRVKAGTIRGYTIVNKPKRKKKIIHEEIEQKEKKENKYKNKYVVWNDILFQSIKELNRYKDLLLLEKSNKIRELRRQVTFQLEVEGGKICKYICDHQYVDCQTGETIVEDVKSKATAKLSTFIIKKKMMKAILGIDVLIV